jgi:hypothetical protein
VQAYLGLGLRVEKIHLLRTIGRSNSCGCPREMTRARDESREALGGIGGITERC